MLRYDVCSKIPLYKKALRAHGVFYLTGYKVEVLNEKRLLKQVGKEVRKATKHQYRREIEERRG